MDFITDLIQSWQIASQQGRTASLEQRVENLEHQLQLVHKVLLTLVQEHRPDLVQNLGQLPVDNAHWRVLRKDEASGLEVPQPVVFTTQAEADAEARRIVGAETQAQVFVAGPQDRRYRVLP